MDLGADRLILGIALVGTNRLHRYVELLQQPVCVSRRSVCGLTALNSKLFRSAICLSIHASLAIFDYTARILTGPIAYRSCRKSAAVLLLDVEYSCPASRATLPACTCPRLHGCLSAALLRIRRRSAAKPPHKYLVIGPISMPWNEEREEGKTAAGHQKPKVEWENGAKHSPDSLKKLGT